MLCGAVHCHATLYFSKHSDYSEENETACTLSNKNSGQSIDLCAAFKQSGWLVGSLVKVNGSM